MLVSAISGHGITAPFCDFSNQLIKAQTRYSDIPQLCFIAL